MTTGTLIIIVLLSVLIGLAGYSIYLLTRDKGESDDVLRERLESRQLEIQKLQDQAQSVQGEYLEANEKISSLRETISRLETQLSEERSQNQEKIHLLENAREKMSLEFKNLANEILEKKGKDFTENNRENIENIL